MSSLLVIDSFRLYRPKICGSGPQRLTELDLLGQVVTAMYISNEAAGLKGPLDLLGQFITANHASNGAATFEKGKIQNGKKNKK